MRILVVTNLYPPYHFGGYEAVCADAVSRWRRTHEVQVLTSDSAPATSAVMTQPEEVVHRLLPIYWDDHTMRHAGFMRALRDERRTRTVTTSVLDSFQPDVVSLWNMGALSFGAIEYVLRRDVPVVMYVCDDYLVWGLEADQWAQRCERENARSRMARLIGRSVGLSTRPSRLESVVACFCSDHTRQRAMRDGRWSFARTPVVGAGVDLDLFPISGEGPRPWQGRLTYVGRLDPRKGVATAIRAVASMGTEATLTLLGVGELQFEHQLEELIHELGATTRVRLDRREGPDAVRAVLADSDALLFPSEWDEPFGIVPLEAMARGVPVITTGTGGSSEFLRDNLTAMTFPPGDADALAAAIRRVGEDPALRARLVRNGHRTAAWLSRHGMLERLLAWHVAATDGLDQDLPGEVSTLPDGLEAA